MMLRDKRSIIPTEFAVSLDNLRPVSVMPCYTLHDDAPEAILLADVLRQVRADRPFWRVFSKKSVGDIAIRPDSCPLILAERE